MKIYDALSPIRAEKKMRPMGTLTFRQLLVLNKRLANLIAIIFEIFLFLKLNKYRNMKNYLSIQIEQKATNTAINAVSFDCRGFKSTAYGLSKKIIIMIFLPFVVLLFVFSSVSAQTVENMQDYLNSANATEVQQLGTLKDGDISTLFVYGQTFKINGETAPTIADIAVESLPELYTSHPEFANIQLLRIKVRNANDLNHKLDLDKLENFENLRYVYVVVMLEVCPENEGNTACQKSKISNMFSGSEGNTYPTVLFEVVSLM
jgi:hypothetical protein